jgi:DNA-binding MarR family transcriptional regulator
MTMDGLSRNEKLTLWGLVRYPTFNDRRLSQEIGLKMSTVTAIRNRLKRAGFFKTVRVPFMDRLGCELLVVCYNRLNILKSRDEVMKILKDAFATTDDIFFAMADPFQMVTFSFCKNYTDAWSDVEKCHQLLSEKGALGPRSPRDHMALYSINQTKFFRFFNFAEILKRHFQLESPPSETGINLKPERQTPRLLSRIEKKVYYGLICHPEIVDNGVAKKIGVTRQSVTKIRKRFESEGILTTIRVPDFQKLGVEILALAYYEFTPGSTLANRKKGIEWVVKELPAFFHIAGNQEGMLAGVAKNFQDLQKHNYLTSKLYFEKGFFRSEPRVIMMSVKDLTVLKDFTFAPFVKRILDINEE